MIDHMLGHKANLSKFKKIKITSRICPNHNAMRLDINYKRKKRIVKQVEAKLYATKQLVDHRRNNQKIKQHLETNENESTVIQNV